jgi:hypothetical protein
LLAQLLSPEVLRTTWRLESLIPFVSNGNVKLIFTSENFRLWQTAIADYNDNTQSLPASLYKAHLHANTLPTFTPDNEQIFKLLLNGKFVKFITSTCAF